MTRDSGHQHRASYSVSESEIKQQLPKLPYWNKLNEGEKEFLERNSAIRSFPKGSFLKGPNESCLGMIYVISGSIRALMVSEEGREVTIFSLDPGDCCILSASCVLTQVSFLTELIATQQTQVLIVNTGAYSKLMEQNIDVKCFSYELATQRSSSVISALQEIIFYRFEQRLARFLLNKSEKTGSDEIVMTKEAISQEVNTAREVVSRTLRQFADSGLVRMDQKTITLTDKDGLREII